jgi:hypothetical protein
MSSQDYIIAIPKCAHGLLFAQIAGMLAYDLRLPLVYTDKTVLVLSTEISDSASLIMEYDPIGFHRVNRVYQDIAFDKTEYHTIGIAVTGTPINFEDLRNRTDSPKCITLSWNDSDMLELSTNNYLMSWFPVVEQDEGLDLKYTSHNTRWFSRKYSKLFGTKFTKISDITQDQVKALAESETHFEEQLVTKGFYEPNYPAIPDDLKDRILVIKYSEIFTKAEDGSYPALDKLLNFMGAEINNVIYANYDDFAKARLTYITNKAPYLLTS